MADYTLSARITGDASGFTRSIDQAKSKLEGISKNVMDAGKNMRNIGGRMTQMGDSLTSKITKPAVAATSALVGITLVKGFQRLAGIDTARAKMMGLGHDTKSVEIIMASALDSVRGTAFGMDEAATTAANAVAAGIPPGKELTRYLTLTGDAAAIAGSSMSEMGSIVNKVTTAGKAYNGELQQLSDRGLPVYQWLGEEAGIASDKVFEFASQGKVSSEMLLNAIENNIGGAAKIMGETSFTAAVANVGAAIGRIGASFLDAGGQGGGFFSTVKPMLSDFINTLDTLAPIAEDLGVKFGNAFNTAIERIGQAKAWFDDLDPSVQTLILRVAGIAAAFAVGIGPALKIGGMLTKIFGGLISVVGFLLSPIGLVITAIVALAAGFAYLWTTSETFRTRVISAFDMVQEKVTSVINSVVPILQNLWSQAQPILSSIGDILGNVFSNVIPFITSSLSNIWGQIQAVFTTITGIVQAVWPVFSGFFSSFIEGFTGAGEVGSNFALNLTSILFGLNPIIKGVIYLFTEFGSEIVAHVQTAIGFILPLISSLGTAFGEIANVVIPLVMNVLGTLIPIAVQVGSTFMHIVSIVLPVLINLFTQLVPILSRIVQWFAGVIGQVVPLARIIISSLLPVIQNMIEIFMNIVSTVAPAFIAIFGAIMSTVEALTPVFMGIVTAAVHAFSMIVSTMNPLISFFGGLINGIFAVVSPIVSFFASTISMVMSVIRPIAEFTQGIFNTIVSIISGTWSVAMNFIASGITRASGFIGNFSATVSTIFTTISSTISKIMNGVSNTIRNVFQGIQNAWSGLTGFINGIFSGVQTSVSNVVGTVTGSVNVMIGALNSAIGLINKIPGVNIGTIPMLYRGTDDWQGGFARMNEGGRGELTYLPGGSVVVPHDLSMRYARESARQNASNNSEAVYVNDSSRVEALLEGLLNKKSDLYLDGDVLVGSTYDRYDRTGGSKTQMDERLGRA